MKIVNNAVIQAVAYFRVSSERQDLDRQRNDIKKECDYLGYKLVKSFEEKESGKIKERPELMAMMEYLQNNPNISYVIISELSRLGRTSFVLSTIEALSKLKIGLISIKERLTTLNEDKTVNATATMITGVLSSINSYELETIAFRMKSGKLNAVRNGGVISNDNYAYGYMKDKNKKLVINPVEAPIVKKIFEMSLIKGCRVIATYLNNKEIPTRQHKKWRDAVVWQMLTNRLYIGERSLNEHVFEAPKIISNELFEAVQANLKSKGNMIGINQKHKYLLNNKLIICGVCGKFYSGRMRANLKGSPHENADRCGSTRYSGENCGNFGVNVIKLENALRNLLINDYASSIANRSIKSADTTIIIDSLKGELKEVNAFIQKQEFKRNNIIDLHSEGIMRDKEIFYKKINEIDKEIIKLQNQAINIESQIKANKKLAKNSIDWFDMDNWNFIEDENGNSYEENFMNNLKKITFDKDLLKGLVSKIVIYPSDKRFTKMSNEICVRCDIYVFNEATQIYISNRSNNIEIVRPTFGDGVRLYF